MSKETTRVDTKLMNADSASASAAGSLQPVGGYMEHTTESSDSIEVTKNPKGYTWSVKLYFVPGAEDATLTRMTWIQARLHQIYGEQAQNRGKES